MEPRANPNSKWLWDPNWRKLEGNECQLTNKPGGEPQPNENFQREKGDFLGKTQKPNVTQQDTTRHNNGKGSLTRIARGGEGLSDGQSLVPRLRAAG